jgi:hypothetical protein
MSTLSGKSSELSALIRVRDEISKEDQARWLAVVERVAALGTKSIAELQACLVRHGKQRY